MSLGDRYLLFLLGVLVVVICAEKPAEGQNGGWCVYYNFDRGGATNCGFATFQQCMAAVSGVAGTADPVRTTRRVLPTISTGLSVLIALQLPQ